MTPFGPEHARGLDVSHYHPVQDWGTLVSSPEKPVFIGVKATEGANRLDPKLQVHRDSFRASSMLLGIYYHFARPGDARAQAEYFMSSVGPLDPRERLCLDLEVPVCQDVGEAFRPHATLAWVDAFYATLTGPEGFSADRRPLIYTSARVWRGLVGDLPWVAGTVGVDLWAPRYNDQGHEPALPVPWAQRGWHVWQWTDGQTPPYTLPGVGACDGNVWNGDEENLRAYMQASLVVATPPGDSGAP
jgi:lysozyme